MRVPQVLYFKRRHDTGVTSEWRRTRETASELTRSYREIIREVALSRAERALVEAVIAARLAVVRMGLSKAHFNPPARRDPPFVGGQPVLRRQSPS
jgi:hypothetical protein